ncbi:MAG: lytic transglycosylase domain-containing protein [Betaproteobacteria bacterium]
MRLLAFCALFAVATSARAARLEIPLRVPLEALREALAAQLAGPKERPRELYRQGPCRFLNLEPPKLEAADGQLRLAAPGAAALGIELGGRCRTPAEWQGVVHFTLAPELDGDGRLRMRIVDSRLDGTDGKRAPTVGVIWDLAKQHLHPRLERFSYDLGASRGAMMGVLREAAPAAQRAAMQDAVNQMKVQPPRVEPAHVLVQIAMEVPDAWLAAPAAPPAAAPAQVASAPLSEAEIEALEKAMAPWDAFLVNSIKQVAQESEDSALRRRLFDLLLASRYRLISILTDGTAPGVDPLRTLFLDSWRELGATLRDAQRDGLLKSSALRYAVFVDAGDALLSLERAAPGLDMRMTPEGLRQLARSLRPDGKTDPLDYDWAQDDELRRLFFAQALPVMPGVPGPAPAPGPARPAPDRTSSLGGFIRVAQKTDGALPELDKWVPERDELDLYGEKVSTLLREVAASAGSRAGLAAPYDRMLRDLIPATALIESCWRQYVVRNGKVSYLKSSAGSVGIMQINQHVWRGFYDLAKVRWDTAYNARAGAEILLRYMKDYAIPYAQKAGDPKLAPRAVYAVCNAGPRAVGRFAKATPHPREKRVDEKLWALYKGIASGGQADLKSCGVK